MKAKLKRSCHYTALSAVDFIKWVATHKGGHAHELKACASRWINATKINMTPTPTTAALARAILNLESEAGKNHIEASLARSNRDEEHARFFLSRESQAREDAKLLSELIGSPPPPADEMEFCDDCGELLHACYCDE